MEHRDLIKNLRKNILLINKTSSHLIDVIKRFDDFSDEIQFQSSELFEMIKNLPEHKMKSLSELGTVYIGETLVYQKPEENGSQLLFCTDGNFKEINIDKEKNSQEKITKSLSIPGDIVWIVNETGKINYLSAHLSSDNEIYYDENIKYFRLHENNAIHPIYLALYILYSEEYRKFEKQNLKEQTLLQTQIYYPNRKIQEIIIQIIYEYRNTRETVQNNSKLITTLVENLWPPFLNNSD